MIPRDIESPVSLDGDQKEVLAPDAPPSHKRTMQWLAITVILVILGFASLIMVGIFWFGSIASALAYLRGDGLIPDAYTKSFGTATLNERPSVEFLLSNYTKQPIKVLGSNSTCTCLVTSNLPLIIPPNGKAILKVNARSKSRSRPYSERVRVLTDSGESKLFLSVQGVFR